MVMMPLSNPANEWEANDAETPACALGDDSIHWARIAAAGSLAVSGVLLMSGKRRAGLVAAVSGTALAMLDQQEAVREWWSALPVYLAEVQRAITRVQDAVDEISAQGEKLRQVLER